MKTRILILILGTLLGTTAAAQKKEDTLADERSYILSAYLWSPTLTIGRYINSQELFQIEGGGSTYRDGNIDRSFRVNAHYKHYFENFWLGSEFFLKGGLEYMNLSYSTRDKNSFYGQSNGRRGMRNPIRPIQRKKRRAGTTKSMFT